MAEKLFKTGDYVSIAEGTKLKSGEIANGWAGRIEKVYEPEKCCLIYLDAQTLDSLEDAYLLNGMETGADPGEYVFLFDDLEPSSRRDTNAQREESWKRAKSRIVELEEGSPEDMMEEQQEQWINEFLQSEMFKSQTNFQQENSIFIIETFMDTLYNYEGVTPENWRANNIVEVCLNVIPRKVAAGIELFENYGSVIESFITFLGLKNYINNSLELVNAVRGINDEIVKEAGNSDNWGMAKSMFMGVESDGNLIDNDEQLATYLLGQNEKSVNYKSRVRPLKSNPFKEIGRNQKISVKYNDGVVKTEIKFKKVERDLIDGKCELIEK